MQHFALKSAELVFWSHKSHLKKLPKLYFLRYPDFDHILCGDFIILFKMRSLLNNLLKTTKAFWLDYKPIQFKTKMLKNFDEFLEDAFKSMKYSTLHTGIQDQLEYCLLLADKDQKVEQSCLQTIFNSDFFWE